jgi:hypothetical protein
MKTSLIVLAWTLVPLSSAFAFHVPEHVKITDRAVSQLAKCGMLPKQWGSDWTQAVDKADENEDYDLFNKWLKYSHYYNPNHPINQPRADSALSVNESVAAIEASPRDVLQVNNMIGRIIHHVQDSSVPAHAVPVSHGFGDGFETYNQDSYYAQPFSPAECAKITAAKPMEVLHDNALATLASLKDTVQLTYDGRNAHDTWEHAYWNLGQGNDFGSYGGLGNSFGKTDFNAGSHAIRVSNAQYTAFKRARLDAAVLATEQVILWAIKARGL